VLIGWFAALPFPYTFAAGAIAGCTELLCLYPLGMFGDLQEEMSADGWWQILSRPGCSSRRARDSMESSVCSRRSSLRKGELRNRYTKAICSSSSSASRLYRGIIPPLMLEAPKRAIKCTSPLLRNVPVVDTPANHSPQSPPTRTGATPSPTAAPNL
jgi:hypothetical protein